MRSERWSTKEEIRRQFVNADDPKSGAGPVLWYENGKKLVDDGEGHICVIGRTGKGKTQCGSHPFVREILEKGESLIMLDPKGDGYRMNQCYVPAEYQRFCIDLRNPLTSPTRWNPLAAPLTLFHSKSARDNDLASEMISELFHATFPCTPNADPFWPNAARNLAQGLAYGMFESNIPKEMIHLNTLAAMLRQSESRIEGTSILKAFSDSLPPDSLGKANLSTYLSAPPDTKGSIHSVACEGLECFSRSRGLIELLSEDTLRILELDVSRPFVLFIILPDEKPDVYGQLAGLLISQVTHYLIESAYTMEGRLKVRVNIILEELGSIGRSIPALPNLMVACRSRNIRMMLVLQDSMQLVDIYEKSKAETIMASIGTTIGFATNNYNQLSEWSRRLGDVEFEVDKNTWKTEPLITPTQLAAMPSGTALILHDNLKFVSRLPFYDEMFDNSSWVPPAVPSVSGELPKRMVFNFKAYVRDQQEKRLLDMMRRTEMEKAAEADASQTPEAEADLMKKQRSGEAYAVVILDEEVNKKLAVAKAVASVTLLTVVEAYKKLHNLPFVIMLAERGEAEAVLKVITDAGGHAMLVKNTK